MWNAKLLWNVIAVLLQIAVMLLQLLPIAVLLQVPVQLLLIPALLQVPVQAVLVLVALAVPVLLAALVALAAAVILKGTKWISLKIQLH